MGNFVIGSVVVLFYPNENGLRNLLQILMNSENTISIVVDNTPEGYGLNLDKIKNMIYIPLGRNEGIAKAQNIGIKKAASLGCKYVCFFDQDSMIPNNYVNNLLLGYKETLNFVDFNISTIGPRIFDKSNGKEYKSHTHRRKEMGIFIFQRQIISSGSLIPIAVINEVGLMDESLFIDYVDHEWCWRAAAKGYQCGLLKNLYMEHKIGYSLNVGGCSINVSAPTRYYYQYRNYFYLLRRKYVPIRWKFFHGVKLLLILIFIPFFLSGKKTVWENIFRGIKDGIKDRRI